jgi:hypothetical protein
MVRKNLLLDEIVQPALTGIVFNLIQYEKQTISPGPDGYDPFSGIVPYAM